MKLPPPLALTLACAAGCNARGGNELQATDVTADTPFSIQVPGGSGARGVWIHFAHDQSSHFVLDGEVSVTGSGGPSNPIPVHLTANHFVQGSSAGCANPTGHGEGRCVSSETFNFRTFNRDVSGRTWLFDLPPGSGPTTLTGRLRRTVGVAGAPASLRVVITG